MEEKRYPQTWYVYTYAYPECMGGNIFYVGKGSGTRLFAHEAEVRTNCSCLKCECIRNIWLRKETVVKRIVFETFDESEALAFERTLIQQNANTIVNVAGISPHLRRSKISSKTSLDGFNKKISPLENLLKEWEVFFATLGLDEAETCGENFIARRLDDFLVSVPLKIKQDVGVMDYLRRIALAMYSD